MAGDDAPNHNHVNYQARIDYIKDRLLAQRLGLSHEHVEQSIITPIAYEPDFPWKYNNFVYRLQLATDARSQHQPGCVPIPTGIRELIVRLSNPHAAGLYQTTRIQNEVAFLTLAADALRHITPSVVPRVFAWGAAGTSDKQLGWIIEEAMPGVPLLEPFNDMTLREKTHMLGQVAVLLKGLQDHPLPATITGWGGLTFDHSGAIVSGPMPTVGQGPWPSLEATYRGRIETALNKADAAPLVRGWRFNGVRERIDAFISGGGLTAELAALPSRDERALVHADFTTDNILYDPATNRITALIDYDFASIQHPAYEFLRSFRNTGGQFVGWAGDNIELEKELAAMRNAKLTGNFPSPLPTSVRNKNAADMDWELALAWEREMERLNVKRPSTLAGIDKLADMDEFLGALLPWRVVNEDFLRMNPDEEDRLRHLGTAERHLTRLMEHMGC